MSTVLSKSYPEFMPLLPPIRENVLYFENTTLKNDVNDTLTDTIELKNSVIEADIIGKSVIINGGKVNRIYANDNISLANCSAGNIISEQGFIEGFNCNKLDGVVNRGEGGISLVNCPGVNTVTSQGGLKLNYTNVNYSVHAQGKAILYHSKMRNLDYTPVYGVNPRFKNCTIGTLTIKTVKKPANNDKKFIVSPRNNELPSIDLIDCTIGRLVFEGEIKKAVIFGLSSVRQVIGGDVVKGIRED